MADHCTIVPQYTGGVLTANCVSCPEVPAVTAVPARTVVDLNYGWNASARSIVTLNGDCYTQFSQPPCLGTVCGLTDARTSNAPNTVAHGFYIFREAGREFWAVSERGVLMTAPVARDPTTDVFRIERVGTTVRYLHNGRLIYTSLISRVGPLFVVACLYAADDEVL